jgi:hypothetical protein
MFEPTLGGLYTGVNRQNSGKIRADSMGCGIHLCTDKSETAPGMGGPKKNRALGRGQYDREEVNRRKRTCAATDLILAGKG